MLPLSDMKALMHASLLCFLRLDMNTSGIIAAAKDVRSARKVHQQFDDKQVTKTYLAVCMGVPGMEVFTVDAPIGQHPSIKIARTVIAPAEGGQPAITNFEVGSAAVLVTRC